jgi:hypothetical protein
VFPKLFRPAADMRLLVRTSLALAAITSVIVPLASASPAQAAILSGPTCSQGSLSQPFLAWGDANYYSLISGGDFEGSLSSWTLSGGAKLVAGSEPYKATGALGKYSMSLPAGASAVTPFTCVNVAYPSFRFYARNEALASSLLVQVLYKTPLGTLTASLGTVVPAGTWQPSPEVLTDPVVGGVLSGGTGQVAFRISAVTGASRIDDLFLDPRMH